jgi:Holliday junction resolvase RusA-like endonuclease
MSGLPGINPPIRIEIFGEPKGVGRTKTRGFANPKTGQIHSTVYTPTKTRIEAGVIRKYAQDAMGDRPLLQGSIEIRFSMFVSIPKSMSKAKRALALATPPLLRPKIKPDVDNAAKFWDQFNSVVWRDDAQISDCHIWKRYSDKPRIVIEIREVCA